MMDPGGAVTFEQLVRGAKSLSTEIAACWESEQYDRLEGVVKALLSVASRLNNRATVLAQLSREGLIPKRNQQ